MSLVAAYSDSESENDSEEESSENQSKACTTLSEVSNEKQVKTCTSSAEVSNEKQANSCTFSSEVSSGKQAKTSSPSKEFVKHNSHKLSATVSNEMETSQDFQIDDDDWLEDSLKKRESFDSQSTLFSRLPQPKAANCEILEEVDDEFVKKVDKYDSIEKPVGSPKDCNDTENPLHRTSLILPKPKTKKAGSRGTVKITIPSLEEIGGNSDSDEDDSKVAPKKTISCQKRSSLFSVLPKPRHSVTVCANKNKMFTQQTNRPLVPHTLTKKKESSSSNSKSNAKVAISNSKSNAKVAKQTNSLVGDFSDSDDESDISTNFFSLGENTTQDTCTTDTLSSVPPNTTAADISTLSRNTSVPSNKSSNDVLPSSKSSNNVLPSSKSSNVLPSNKSSDVLPSSKSSSNVLQSPPTALPPNSNNISVIQNVKNDPKSLPKKEITTNKSSNKGNSFFSNLYKSGSNTETAKSDRNTTLVKLGGNITTVPKKSNKKTATQIPLSSGKSRSLEKVTSSSVNTTQPDKRVPSLHGDVTGPYGDVTGPYGDVAGPYGDVTGPYGDVTGPYGNVTGPYSGVTAHGNAGGSNRTYAATGNNVNPIPKGKCYPTSSDQFFTYDYKNKPTETIDSTPEVDYSNRPNEDLVIDKDALRVLQGTKRKHENINLIDVHTADVCGDKEEFLRNLTTEVPHAAQQKMKHAEDQPTHLQKRKHQIQYLAHQAKERELQLQQAWAEGRAMKQHTASKYGF